jgi:hypothetical protein
MEMNRPNFTTQIDLSVAEQLAAGESPVIGLVFRVLARKVQGEGPHIEITDEESKALVDAGFEHLAKPEHRSKPNIGGVGV